MGEAACRGPRERHSPGPNLALNGPANEHKSEYPLCLINEPKVAYRNKRLLFWLPTCLSCSYSIA